MKQPETWNDTESIEAELRLWLQSDIVHHDPKVLEAFRIGWKAGARKSTIDMWHWINAVLGLEQAGKDETENE